jgi:MYXO-CTERM domain-containing protein
MTRATFERAVKQARLWMVAVVAAAAGLAGPGEARACSCGGSTLAENVNFAAAVFEGIAREDKMMPGGEVGRPTAVMRFEVTRRWKGEVLATQPLFYVPGTSCTRTWVVGRSYLIFAFPFEGGLLDNPCSLSGESAVTSELIAALGPGMAPVPDPPAPAPVSTPAPAPDAAPLPAPVVAEAPRPASSGCGVTPATGSPAFGAAILLAVALLVGRLRRRRARSLGQAGEEHVRE